MGRSSCFVVAAGSLPTRAAAGTVTLTRPHPSPAPYLLALCVAVVGGCGRGPETEPDGSTAPARVERDAFSDDVAARPEPPPVLRRDRGTAIAEVSRGSARGRFALAQTQGVIDAPRGLRLVIHATPDQVVDVRWSTTCTRDRRSGSRVGQLRERTPIDRPLPMAVDGPDSCVAAANATLDQGGSLRIRLLARYTTRP
jgi:hypothetical protein